MLKGQFESKVWGRGGERGEGDGGVREKERKHNRSNVLQ